jgi:hypothetical protein
MLCREQIAQLRGIADEIRAHGARLAFIGNGTPEQAAALSQELDLDDPLFTDPELRSFRALAARRTLVGVLHPGTFLSAARAWRGGHRQRGVQGDAMQLGAVAILRPGDEVSYLHRSTHAGDHPEPTRILRRLAAIGEPDRES